MGYKHMGHRDKRRRKPVYSSGANEYRLHERMGKIAAVPELNQNTFIDTLTKATKPVLVIFTSDLCMPCRYMLGKPEYKYHNGGPYLIHDRPPHYSFPNQPGYFLWQVLNDFKGQIDVVTVDINRSPELRSAFNVRHIPDLVLCYDGRYFHQETQVIFRDERLVWIKKCLAYLTLNPSRPGHEGYFTPNPMPLI